MADTSENPAPLGSGPAENSTVDISAEVQYTGAKPESWFMFMWTLLGTFVYTFMASCSFYYSWNTLEGFGYGWLMKWALSIGCGLLGILGIVLMWFLKLFRIIRAQDAGGVVGGAVAAVTA